MNLLPGAYASLLGHFDPASSSDDQSTTPTFWQRFRANCSKLLEFVWQSAVALREGRSARSIGRRVASGLNRWGISMEDTERACWLAVENRRHVVINRRDVTVGPDVKITTVCGLLVVRPEPVDYDWLWPTCVSCWNAVAEQIGAPKMRTTHAGGPGQAPVLTTSDNRKA